MNILVEEYGMLVIACVSAVLFMVIIHSLLYGGNSIKIVYNTDVVDVKAFSDDISGMALVYSPHFVASTDLADYKITGDTFTKDDAMKIVKIYNTDVDNDEAGAVPYSGDVTILVTQYDLLLTSWQNPSKKAVYVERGACPPGYDSEDLAISAGWKKLKNPVPVHTYVEKTDKYGNTQFRTDGSVWSESDIRSDSNPDGELVSGPDSLDKYTDVYGYEHKLGERKAQLVDSLAYKKTYLGELGTDTLKEIKITPTMMEKNYDMPPRYKLVYRAEVGGKKAEYTTLVIKDNN